jgi:hypothetical protein
MDEGPSQDFSNHRLTKVGRKLQVATVCFWWRRNEVDITHATAPTTVLLGL